MAHKTFWQRLFSGSRVDNHDDQRSVVKTPKGRRLKTRLYNCFNIQPVHATRPVPLAHQTWDNELRANPDVIVCVTGPSNLSNDADRTANLEAIHSKVEKRLKCEIESFEYEQIS